MKKLLPALLVVLCSLRSEARIVTSVMNGDFSNANVWDCSCVPVSADTIVIDHQVVLDFDFVSNGGITVNPLKYLNCIGNYTNLTVSGGFFINNGGSVTMGTYSQVGGTFYSDGDFDVQDDMLLDQISNVLILGTTWSQHMTVTDSLIIFSSASIMIDSGMLHSGQVINHGNISVGSEGWMITHMQSVNYGTITVGGQASFYLSLYNYGTINVFDQLYPEMLYNSAQILVSAGAWIYSTEFINGDTIGGLGFLINDGTVWTVGRFENNADVNGTGKFCTLDSTINHGNVTGTLDFCDQTGSVWDVNTGTEAGTVTHCTNNNCSIGIEENQTAIIGISPNPSNETIRIQWTATTVGVVEVIDITGRVVMREEIAGKETLLSVQQLPNGIYTVSVIGAAQRYTGRFVKQ